MRSFRILTSTLLLCACTEPSSEPATDSGPSAQADAGPPQPLEPHPLAEAMTVFYEALQEDALAFGFEDGEWLEDFGDAAFFGPAFYLRAAVQDGREDYLEIASQARDYNRSVVEQAGNDTLWLVQNLEEVFMATQGLIEYAGLSGDAELVAPLDRLLSVIDDVIGASGDYLDVSIGAFAADLYGPTSITAGIALIYLQYAKYLDTAMTATRIQRAVEIVGVIEEQVGAEDHYRFSPDETKLYLYPNATMLIVLARLFELRGDERYRERAAQIYAGLRPLHHEEEGFYQSPYSQEYQGAQTDAYATLSSQNYLSIALLLLFQQTDQQPYLDDVFRMQDHVRLHLYDHDEGKVLHHWIDGRAASRDDPDYFCSGCNLQTLYILWYLQNELGVIP